MDSRTASSGAILRCTAASWRFSSTALTPSSAMPTAVVPMSFHGLADGGERRRVKGAGGNVVKADDGAMFGNAQSGFGQRADGAEGGHVIEGHEGGEGTLLFEQVFGEFVAVLRNWRWDREIPEDRGPAGDRFRGRWTWQSERIPFQRGALSAKALGPRMKAILRCPSE